MEIIDFIMKGCIKKYIIKPWINKSGYINPILIGILLLIKSMLFTFIVTYGEQRGFKITDIARYLLNVLFICYAAFIAILISFGYLFKNKSRNYFLLILDSIISLLFLADLGYYRAYAAPLLLKQVINPQLFNPLNKFVFNFKITDIFFVLDIVILIIYVYRYRNKECEAKRRILLFNVLFIASVFIIGKYIYLFDKLNITGGNQTFLTQSWVQSETISGMSPIGYHFYDIFMTLKEKAWTYKLQSQGMDDVTKWIDENKEDLPDNKYKGIYQGKNVVFIQVESLDAMLINSKISSQEVTPNLNKLLSNSLYFTNIYEQNGRGMSSDADLMANTSVLPLLGQEITAFDYPDIKTVSISSLLKSKGYNSISSIGEAGNSLGGFNWQQVHKICFEFDNVYDYKDLNKDEFFGLGLSDGAYYEGMQEKIAKLKQPFFAYTISLSSHYGYDCISDKYKELDLPQSINSTVIGDYCQSFRYTDKQIGKLISYITDTLKLDNTVFVIYGDHASLHRYAESRLSEVNTEETWWKDQKRRIPLIIYTPHQDPEVFDVYGGQIDILPTIAYMMGIDRSEFEDSTMGRVLVNTDRNCTIFNDKTIKGDVKDDEERSHVSASYDIAEKFIRGNYLKWKNSKK